MPAFIPDGYEQTEILPANQWYEEVEVSFRPAMLPERNEMLGTITTMNAREDFKGVEVYTAKFMVEHVTKWSLQYDKTGLPVDEVTMLRLEPHFSTDLFQLVSGIKHIKELEEAAKNLKRD